MQDDHPILLYDGVCGLCNGLNQFVLARDKAGRFRFAALQSEFARDILRRHGRDPDRMDTFYVVIGHGSEHERLLARARAALVVLRTIGGAWRVFSVFGVLPTFVLDLPYRVIARNRYRLFGRYDQCLVPRPEWKDRFIASE